MRGVLGFPGRQSFRLRVPFYIRHAVRPCPCLGEPHPLAGVGRVVPTLAWHAPPSEMRLRMRPRDGGRRFGRGAKLDACRIDSVTLPTNVVTFTLGA